MHMLIKTRRDGRVLGPEQLGCEGYHMDQVGCGPILREPERGRVVRGPALQLQARVQGLGERRWVARGHGEGRVLPREWLIDPNERPTLLAETPKPVRLEILVGAEPALQSMPQPNRAA